MKPIEILLIEDDEEDMVIALEAFTESGIGCRISFARDGEEALNYLFKRKEVLAAVTPDVIVLDINLPRVGGMDVLRALRADAALKNIPVVILTTQKYPTDLMKVQADLFLSKPETCSEYLGIVRSINNLCVAHPRVA